MNTAVTPIETPARNKERAGREPDPFIFSHHARRNDGVHLMDSTLADTPPVINEQSGEASVRPAPSTPLACAAAARLHAW